MYHQPTANPGFGGPYLYQWNDDRCNMKHNYICKYEPEINPTAPVEKLYLTNQPGDTHQNVVVTEAGHPDKHDLWGALGRAGHHHPGCWLPQAEVLPGVLCLLFTWEFARSVGNKDQSGNAALTHLSADSTQAPILGCSHSAIFGIPPSKSF
uniref:uncharacterized protein LOC100391789 n=1 Tax=Callithrix jacchus TaxID=9483 RepID=UPI0023DD0081|nr:uncharacterized protein LOC100391789 [Callithrix jacchus]